MSIVSYFVKITLSAYHIVSYALGFFSRFNQLILQDIQWLVLAPFVAMVITLLVSHGFPAKDLLPVTLPSKKR